MREFILKEKSILSLSTFILIGALVAITSFFLFLQIIPINTLILSGFLSLASVQLVYFFLKKMIVLTFDNSNHTLTIKIDDKEKTLSYNDIKGIYSYNYLKNNKISHVSMQIEFTDGTNLEINDITFTSYKFDPTEYEKLRNFLKTVEQELDFKPTAVSKSRKFWKAGAVYFSKA